MKVGEKESLAYLSNKHVFPTPNQRIEREMRPREESKDREKCVELQEAKKNDFKYSRVGKIRRKRCAANTQHGMHCLHNNALPFGRPFSFYPASLSLFRVVQVLTASMD